MADDLDRLVAINSFFVEGASAGLSVSARAYRTSRGRTPYRKIAYVLVSPEKPGALGALAERVFRERNGGWRSLRSPDFASWRGCSRGGGELLSFLLFDEAFLDELIEAGRHNAQRWLDRHRRLWCADAAHDFEEGRAGAATVREEVVLAEWRSLRRR